MWQYLFKSLAPKHPNRAFSVPNLDIDVFCEILQIDKVESADFKYDNSFLKILNQKFSNKKFLVPNLAIFIISWNFAIRPIRGC